MPYNSTIISKKKICTNCGKKDYWFSNKMCRQCSTISSTSKRIEKYEELNNDELESINNLTEDLDAVFSSYIRLKYSDNKGIAECYTCGIKLPYKQIQNGHYIHRIDKATRFLPENCRPQCPKCNNYHNDHPEIYRNKLEQEQAGITDWLAEIARQVYKPTRIELKELLSEYRHKLELVKRKLK